MTRAYDQAAAILEEKGLDLSDADVEQIKFLSAGFTYEEATDEKPWLFECIDQVRNTENSKLSPDGST